MIVKSPTEWKNVFNGMHNHEIAQAIINELGGYRKTALTRATDADTLTNAIQAIVNATIENERL